VENKVIIYGKDGWEYTAEARKAFGNEAVYRDVRKSGSDLGEMLKLSGGARKVPVILEEGKVRIGYGGTW